MTHEEITAEVSIKILEWLDEFERTRNIVTDYRETEPHEEDNEAEGQDHETANNENGISDQDPQTFQHRSPIIENEAPELPTDETVKTEIRAIIEALSEVVEQSPLKCDEDIEIVGSLLGRLAMVQQMIIDIRDRAQRNQDEEAS